MFTCRFVVIVSVCSGSGVNGVVNALIHLSVCMFLLKQKCIHLSQRQPMACTGDDEKMKEAEEEDDEIDAVYTWVNGSDPLLIDNIIKYQTQVLLRSNLTIYSYLPYWKYSDKCHPTRQVKNNVPIDDHKKYTRGKRQRGRIVKLSSPSSSPHPSLSRDVISEENVQVLKHRQDETKDARTEKKMKFIHQKREVHYSESEMKRESLINEAVSRTPPPRLLPLPSSSSSSTSYMSTKRRREKRSTHEAASHYYEEIPLSLVLLDGQYEGKSAEHMKDQVPLDDAFSNCECKFASFPLPTQ